MHTDSYPLIERSELKKNTQNSLTEREESQLSVQRQAPQLWPLLQMIQRAGTLERIPQGLSEETLSSQACELPSEPRQKKKVNEADDFKYLDCCLHQHQSQILLSSKLRELISKSF